MSPFLMSWKRMWCDEHFARLCHVSRDVKVLSKISKNIESSRKKDNQPKRKMDKHIRHLLG